MKEPGEIIDFISPPVRKPTKGSAGLSTQLPGCATTVSALADATGGLSRGALVRTESV